MQTILTSTLVTDHATAANRADLIRYFESTELETGLQEVPFGEFLVDQGVLDRYQLLCALQLQDRRPGLRLGEAAAMLGYAPLNAIERLVERFDELNTLDVD